MEPKVFISHASEDKARFVVAFAERLRANGVDAWLDQWEMRPDDSLVDKVFEQGLAQAQAVIVVLSAVSVTKPWVREELNVSVVKRINKGLKLIPVVIDRCEVPEALQSTIWQRIDDLASYDDAFQRILAALFDTSPRPVLGERPARFAAPGPKIAGLNQTDELVLREIAYREIDLGDGPVTYAELREDPDVAAVPEEQLLESLDILAQRQLIEVERSAPPISHTRLTMLGFRQYAQSYIADYAQTVATLGGLIVNERVYANGELATRSGKPTALVNFVLDVLAEDGHIELEKYGGGLWEVCRASASLKRSLP
jgi:hypothetical protein